jgi:hypothetical protein
MANRVIAHELPANPGSPATCVRCGTARLEKGRPDKFRVGKDTKNSSNFRERDHVFVESGKALPKNARWCKTSRADLETFAQRKKDAEELGKRWPRGPR